MLRNLSYLYIAFALATLVTGFLGDFPTIDQHNRLEGGCYWTDALVPYIECHGVFANELTSFFLNYWLYMLYMVIAVE